VSGDWNVPPPPPAHQPRSAIRAKRVWAGIGVALAAHLLTLLGVLGGAAMGSIDALGYGVIAMLIGQVVVFLVCLVLGVVLIVRNEGGFGVGLLIGWAVGLLIVPVAGFGLCVWLFSSPGFTG
jgi:hypothetical protein